MNPEESDNPPPYQAMDSPPVYDPPPPYPGTPDDKMMKVELPERSAEDGVGNTPASSSELGKINP